MRGVCILCEESSDHKLQQSKSFQMTKEFILRNMFLSGSFGCIVIALFLCLFSASSLMVAPGTSEIAFKMAEQQNLRRYQLFDDYIQNLHTDEHSATRNRISNNSSIGLPPRLAERKSKATKRQENAISMLTLCMGIIGPQLIFSSVILGAYFFSGRGLGNKAEQTKSTAALLLSVLVLLYACGGNVIFYRLYSQWSTSRCISESKGQVMHLSLDAAPDICQGRLLHILCYLNEEVDCDIVITALTGFFSACICTVFSAVLLLAAIVEIRLDRVRSPRSGSKQRLSQRTTQVEQKMLINIPSVTANASPDEQHGPSDRGRHRFSPFWLPSMCSVAEIGNDRYGNLEPDVEENEPLLGMSKGWKN